MPGVNLYKQGRYERSEAASHGCRPALRAIVKPGGALGNQGADAVAETFPPLKPLFLSVGPRVLRGQQKRSEFAQALVCVRPVALPTAAPVGADPRTIFAMPSDNLGAALNVSRKKQICWMRAHFPRGAGRSGLRATVQDHPEDGPLGRLPRVTDPLAGARPVGLLGQVADASRN